MKKNIKLKISVLFSLMLMVAVSHAAEPEVKNKKEVTVETEEQVIVVPDQTKLSDAPTLKEVAEKQEAKEKAFKKLVDAPVAGPYDEYNRSTPRSSLVAFSLAVKNNDYGRSVQYLDLRNLPFALDENLDGEDLVRKLVIIAKRGMTIDFEDLSDDPHGHKDDGLPPYRDRITTMKTKEGPVDILMQRVPRGDGVYVWKISNTTVAKIPALDKEFGYGVIGNKLSSIFPHYVVAGFEVWQLVMLLGLVVVGYVISWLSTSAIVQILHRNNRFDIQRLQKFIVGPLRFLILVLIFRATFDMIAPSLTARALFEAKTMLIIALYWVMLGIVDVIIYRLADRMGRNGQQDAVVLLKPAATGVKLVIAMFAIISWMDNLGYQVTTILAGLGVGGVAVALAAQKSLENLIGSITIYMSQPVRVGDFCKFGDTVGTVEEIGLRSTQLRTLARTVVHIPNAMFASDMVENLTQRDKILYRTRLKLSYDDKAEQIRQVLEKIRQLIDEHAFIDQENSRVRFLEFGKYAQELELYVYIKTKDFAEYLEHCEDINLRLSDIVESSGAHLTVPAKNISIDQKSASPIT